MKMKIGIKLLAGFVPVVLLMTAMALYSVHTGEKSLENSVGKTSIFLAEEMLKTINRDIYLKIEALRVHTSHFLFQKILMESNRQFEGFGDVQEWIDGKDKTWVSAPRGEITPFMKSLIYNPLSNSLRKEIAQYYERRYGYPVFGEIFVTNRFGAVIAETHKTLDYREDDESWWQVAREKGFSVGNVAYDESSRTYAISIGIRIVDASGDFAGVMKAVVDTKGIVREAEMATKKYETTRVQVITEDGRLIYSTKAFQFLEDLSGTGFFKKIRRENGSFLGDSEGKKILYSHARSQGYRGFQGLGWILVVGHDVQEVLAPAFSLRNRILVVSLILIAVAIFIALFMSRSITRPIAELIRGAGEIGKGHLDYRIPVVGSDEMGQLAASFNEMAARRKREEQILRESEERFRSFFDTAAIGMVMGDTDGCFVQVNGAFCEIVGYDEKALIGRPFQSLVHLQDLEEELPLLARLLEGEIPHYHREERLIHREGREVWTHVSVSLIRDKDGRPVNLIAGVEDITEERRAQEGIHRQGATFEGMTRVFRDALTCETDLEVAEACLQVAEQLTGSRFGYIGEVNGDGLFDTMAIRNPGWEACGMPDSEATKRIKNMPIRGFDRSTLREEKSRRVNDPDHHPDRVGTPEGHPPITSFLGVPFKQGGRFTGMIGLANKEQGYDAADQETVEALSVAFVEALSNKRNEMELKKYRYHLEGLVAERTAKLHQMSRVFMDASDPIIIEDLEGMVIHLNDEAERIYGWNREELLGKPVKLVVPPERHDQADGLLDRCKRGELVRNVESLRWNKAGERSPVLITLSLLAGDGTPNAVASICKHIGDLKDTEEALKKRTADLERSNQELEQFAYVASHDLQEPLRKVQAFGDRFVARYGDQVDEKGRDYLARMQSASGRMATMIQDLLSLSRVTTKGETFVPVNLWEEVQKVLSDLEVAIDECGGLFEIGELPIIEADPSQIRQLMQNLLSNAFKYRKPGESPLVKIYAVMTPSEGPEGEGLCRIHVEDNGIGFDEKYTDRIFQPFQRLHGRSEYEGTGIGLSVCRKIVARHGGSITAKSEPGRGSVFIVTLPVNQQKETSKHG